MINDIINAIEQKEDRELDLFNAEFESILLKIDKLLTVAVVSIKDPLDFDFEVQRILNESGYYDLINRLIDSSYDKSYDDILLALKETGVIVTFSQEDLQQLQQLKQLDIDFFNTIGDETAGTLKRDLYKYHLSNMSKDEMIDNIKASLGNTKLARYSKTYAETSLSNYHQAVFDLKIQGLEDDLVYIYSGADPDKVIRDFCKCVMKSNKYYSRIDGNALKNDSRRKYNCRHRVVGITEKRAIELGYEKGSFTC